MAKKVGRGRLAKQLRRRQQFAAAASGHASLQRALVARWQAHLPRRPSDHQLDQPGDDEAMNFRDIKARVTGVKPSSASDEQTPFGSASGKIAPSNTRMQAFKGLPISSNDPGLPDGQTSPAFSCPIVPGRHEAGALQPGPAYRSSIAAGTQPMNLPNKSDATDIGKRGKPITY